MRTFDTGATRDSDTTKLDYEGFLSPLVLQRYAEFMHKHRRQADGKLRDSDNWQRGIPITAYMKSLWRHFVDVWRQHRGLPGEDTLEDSLCAVLFNATGMLHETVKQRLRGPQADLFKGITCGDCRRAPCTMDPRSFNPLVDATNHSCFRPKTKEPPAPKSFCDGGAADCYKEL